MTLSKHNAIALLLDTNQDVEEYAYATVKNVVEDKNFDFISYPPNGGLTDQEKVELSKLENNTDLKNALRKIIADSAAGVVFNMLNLLDGTSSPKNDIEWTGVKLVDEEAKHNQEVFGDMLHDTFLETFWDWQKLRVDKSWKLDNYEE